MRFTLKNPRSLQYIDYQNVRKTEFLGCQSQEDPTVGLNVCFGATILLVIAGTIAGLAPARKAAKVRPIEALRSE